MSENDLSPQKKKKTAPQKNAFAVLYYAKINTDF